MGVVFLLQGRDVPAARFRGFAIAEGLKKRGTLTATYAPVPSVYGDLPRAWHLSAVRPFFVPWVLLPRLAQLRRLRDHDIVFIQRPLLELPLTFLESQIAKRHKTIFDFDDAIYLNWRGSQKIRRLVTMADHVIVGNEHLAKFVAQPAKTTVIPTAVDLDRYVASAPRPTRGPDVVVGWTGLSGNYRHLATAVPAIARALRQTSARFLIISDKPPPTALRELRPEFLPWTAAHEIRDLDRIDIGVMPLRDGERERGKCAFKLIQYMALGKCGIASPVGANLQVVEDGQHGYLPATDGDWTERLVHLIEDPDARERMGTAARERIRERYSLESVLPKYEQIVRRLAEGTHA
jgi:glycosyltransferase involved in cell wall biosynthesis